MDFSMQKNTWDPIQFLNRAIDGLLGIRQGEILNQGKAVQPEGNLVETLQNISKELIAESLDLNEMAIDYQKLRDSEPFARFRRFTLALPNCRLADLGDQQHQMAFWLNLYNVLIIDGLIHYRLEGSLLRKPSFFRRAAYNVAGFRFSADDIEHGILRGNRPSPFYRLRHFGTSDPRVNASIEPVDPRIHFALVCGSKSCPPISSYQADQLDEQLNLATRNFINGGSARFDKEKNVLLLSKIFQWYRSDLGGKPGILKLIGQYIQDENVKGALDFGEIRIRYLPYDWTVNRLEA
jgi:hypothetical protein